jgi:predicted PP-loop superfamily ATPase
MASMELSATRAQTPMISPTQLSEAFMLERADRLDRRAERAERAERQTERERAERQTEWERADRSEARLVAAFSVATCTCGLGAAVIGAALLRGRGV